MTITTPPLTYQQMVFLFRQLPLTERVRLVRDILAEPGEEQGQTERSVLDIIESAPGQRLFKTASEVDEYLERERDAWDT
jgi:hypothetical protein